MEEKRTTGPGIGGVHSEIGVQPSKGEGMSGKYDAPAGSGGGSAVDTAKERAGGMADQARHKMDDAREQLGNAADQARDHMGDLRGRAEEMAGQARTRANEMLDQAESSEPVRMARENPLPALGIAFAAGFLLAGSSDTGGKFGKAKHQIRGAVMGGISAALAQELRGMMGMQGGQGGAGGLLDSLLGKQGSESGGGGQQPQGSAGRQGSQSRY